MKHKKLSARILSFVLTAAMVFTLLPQAVFAAEGDASPQAGSASTAPTEGGTYYFDLSSEINNIGTINKGGGSPSYPYFGVPDTSLHYVPFTYVGEIDAYNLPYYSDSNTAKTSGLRTLFVADYNISKEVSWNTLHNANLIFGKVFDTNYTLRSLSVGDRNGGNPTNNEWSQILSKSSNYIKNWQNIFSWGQEVATDDAGVYNNQNRALRGRDTIDQWAPGNKSEVLGHFTFRPALEVKPPNNLKAITLDLNGSSFDSNGSVTGGAVNSLSIVCAGNTFKAPSATGLTRPNGDTGNYFKWSTEQNGGTIYDAGASVPSSVTALYAQWKELVPAITVGTQTGTATYGTVATPTYAVTASNFGGSYPEFVPSVAWTGTAPTGVTTAFSSDKSTLTMTTAAETPAGEYKFKVVSAKTPSTDGNYESATATLKVGKRTATITWGTTTSFIYNGTERAPTATVSNKVGSDEVIVTVTGGQTNVNSYVATADTLTGTAALNYELPTTKPTQNFTITPKPVNVRLSGGCVLKVYDGTTNPGTSTVNIKTDDIIAGTGVDAYISKIPAYPSNIASNSHRLRVQVALNNNIYGNYELKTTTLDVQGIITAKPVTLNDGDLIITKEYDGTASAGTVDRFLSSADFETIDTNNNNVSVLITNVGDYADASVGTGKTVNLQVELTGSMKGNYRLANSSYSFTKAQIAQALPKVTVTAEKKATFSLFGIPIGNKEDTFIITATVDGVNGEKPAGTVQLKANGTALGAPLTLTNGVATYEWVQPNANTYTFTADFVGTGPNYATNSGTSEQYDISKAEQAPLTFTVASPVTYGDIPIAFNATGGTGTGAVTYSSSDTNVVLDDGTIKGVGTATITATKAADANYNAATATATITVNPAAPTLAWTADVAETLTYTGSEAVITKTPAVTLKNGETYSGTIKYAYKKAGLFSLFAVYTDGLPTDAGEYTIKAHIDAAGNYIAADSTNELTLTITKSTPTVSIKIDNYSGKTYDGTAIANPVVGDLNISGANYDDVTFVYSATVDMSNPSATAPTNAGTYYVQASIAASDNTNVAQSVAKEFTIAKKAVNATVTGNDKVYDGNNTANIALSVNTGIAADKISITATGATYDNKNVASNKTITTGGFITTGDKQDNYDITIPIITGKITQKTVSVTATVAAKDYDGSTNATATYTIEDKIATDTVTATATATFDNANVGIDKTVNITSIALAGKDNANYKLNSTTATAQGTINKANVTVTIEPIAVVDFTGTQIKPTVTVKTADGTALVTTDYTIAYGANVDAGTGLVTVKVAANGNYTFTDVTANFIINKITYTGTAITGTKLVVQNTAQKGVEFDLSTLTFPAGFKDKTFKSANIVTNTDNVLTGTPSITGTKLTFDVGSVVKDKSGEINVVVESKNYNDYTAKITVTTVDKTPITINGTAATGLVYNGSAQQGYTTVAVEGNKVPQDGLDFTYSGTDKSGATYGPTTTAPTKAGDYKLVVSVKSSNATYTGTSSDILFSIEQKPLTIKAKNQVTYQHKLDESGKPDIPVAELEYSGFVSSEDATALGANAYAAMHTAMVTTDAGKFTINVLGSTANTNYSITTASGNLTIQAVTVPKAPITTPPTSTVTEPEIVAKPDDPAKQLRVFSGELAQEDKTETLKQLTVPTGGVTTTKEVELQVSADGGNTWKKATEADVKDRRVQVVFPIHDGTSPSTHTYVIYHFAKGATVAPVSLDTTVSEPTKSLSATVSSLSPFVAVATPKGGGNPGGGDSDDDSSTTYYYIKATAGPGGSMSTAERVKVRAGESAGFTITPDKGYQIADVLVNGKSIGAKNYYAFTKVYSDQTIHATFKKVGHQNPQTGVNFDDVTTDDWFYDAVMEATSNG